MKTNFPKAGKLLLFSFSLTKHESMPKRPGDFNFSTRYRLASRVGWICSYPGCGRLTIGPGLNSEKDVTILGQGGHIHSAGKKGPRAKLGMDENQLSDITNGIWLCMIHHNIVDSNESEFTAETLKKFKAEAEIRAFSSLENFQRILTRTELAETLVAITGGILFLGVWAAANGNTWMFRIVEFIKGDLTQMQELFLKQSNIANWEKYVAIESQGDGRPLEEFSWERLSDGTLIVNCQVGKKVERTNPQTRGADIAFDFNERDLLFADGDFGIVWGVDAAIQHLIGLLIADPGGYADGSIVGSHFSKYCKEYHDNPSLLAQMIKIEVIRLMSVGYSTDSIGPELDFINRVVKVEVPAINKEKREVTVNLELELGDESHWEGQLQLVVGRYPYREL